MKVTSSASNRFWILVIFMFISGLVTTLRLTEVQIIKGHEYLRLSEENRLFRIILPRQRGIILDRYQQPLVENYPLYYQVADPDQVFAEKQLISTEEALPLMASQSGSVETAIRRVYPLAEVVAPVLGYTGKVSLEDLNADSNLMQADIVGKQGLEKHLDQKIRGQIGEEIYEVDAHGTKRRLISFQRGEAGESVETSIDPFLSYVAFQAMGQRKGSVIISDAANGEVLTLVSTPSFDPNVLTAQYADSTLEKFRQQTVSELFSDERKLFFNRAVSGTYPPGSVFKLVTAAAGLSSGALDESTTVNDEGVLEVGEYSYANWYYSQYGGTDGEIALQRAIARSNDIYFYKAAEWVGPNKLAQAAGEFGYGHSSGIELSGEAEGLVPDVDWKEQVLGERWFLGNTYHFGIGQGNLLVTPIQVNQMVQAIANHGSRCDARLIHHERPDCQGLPLAEEHLDLILNGMLDACSSGGTAFPFFSWNEQYRDEDLPAFEQVSRGAVACKTGTAEFGASDERGYKKTHGWFVMTVGVEDLLKNILEQQSDEGQSSQQQTQETDSLQQEELPDSNSSKLDSRMYRDHQLWLSKLNEYDFPEKIIITVLVESDEEQPFREGSRDAAPVAKEILDWMVQGQPVQAAPVAEPAAGQVGE